MSMLRKELGELLALRVQWSNQGTPIPRWLLQRIEALRQQIRS